FLVPALVDKMHLHKRAPKSKRLQLPFITHHRTVFKRAAVVFTRFYRILIRFLCRWRVAVCILMVLLFGLPVFMIPEKLEGEGKWTEFYNKVFGSPTYKEKVKPVTDKVLGGSLRLFVQKVYEGSYFTRNEEVVLYVNANLPNGSTLEQMNNLVKRMEIYLSEFKEIKQFQTSVYSPLRGNISIYFTDEHQRSGFPYSLKSNIISKALQLGGGSWGVYGLQDMGFSNDVRENAGSFRINMYGYNYDELYTYAEQLKARLLERRRIKEVLINSEFSWWKDDYREFYFDLNKTRMAEEGISAMDLFASMQPIFGKDMETGNVATDNGLERIKLSSRQSHEYDVWALQYFPYQVNGRQYKLGDLAIVEKGQMPQQVAKENQQYRLCVQYEYIGSSEQGRKLQERDLEEFNKKLPMGYTAEPESNSWYWNKKDNKQYLLLLVIIAIIFFISSILFNSLRQPLAIIFVIPVSYIGVFLTFYWFKLNFDQGGFAAFVLLCGITVNASIYVLNEYNSIRRRSPGLSPLRAYTKAWNAKVMPIFLTIVSTILGFIPFMVGTDKESFWFPLAAGTIGGLVMSLIGVFFLLPILTLKKRV
ncbi:efflux RND transporter permease subunit, partial [Bacteroides sp. OttesenSCG-928-D19]|nr:efflux RND transporter permease subunit [Bacteroides sp. OttesenSCG-928-D19]